MTSQNKWGIIIAPIAVAIIFLGVIQSIISSSQSESLQTVTAEEELLLKQIMPQADVFSTKDGDLPHHKAYKTDPETGANALVGLAFLSTEIEADEWGYGGQIDVLIGMNMQGVITGVTVVDHIEPFGYFSIDPPEFADQFEGKSIFDRFEEGRDIDAVSGASITVDGAARVVGKSARKIARRYLTEAQIGRAN